MGSCVSVHKSRKLSALKLHLSMRSKNDKSVAPSPVKEKPAEVTGGEILIANLALKSQWSPASPTTPFRDSGTISRQIAIFPFCVVLLCHMSYL